jgi:chemotaxis family two-component system sensor kinase Cph1
VVKMFADRAANEDVHLCWDIAAGLPDVDVDAPRITQVLSNLVGNAIKFTPKGSITIGAAQHSDEIIVSVRDTGVGIPPNEIPHVFDRYWHARRDSATRGTGLGLAIAHGIVLRHDGRIWVESRAGEGSTFYFTLRASAAGGPTTRGHRREREVTS